MYACLQQCTSAVGTPQMGWIELMYVGYHLREVGGGVMGDGGGGCVADVMVGHYTFLWGTNIMDISGKGEVIHTL